MKFFRRRKNPWLVNVIEGELDAKNSHLLTPHTQKIASIETALPSQSDLELGEDIGSSTSGKAATHSEGGVKAVDDVNVGVTDNAPYHNRAKYKMVNPNDDDSTISTHSS